MNTDNRIADALEIIAAYCCQHSIAAREVRDARRAAAYIHYINRAVDCLENTGTIDGAEQTEIYKPNLWLHDLARWALKHHPRQHILLSADSIQKQIDDITKHTAEEPEINRLRRLLLECRNELCNLYDLPPA